MREQFTEQRFSPASLRIIDIANDICADYRRQGFDLTLRQLYYQFVARDLLPNKQQSYKRLGSIINDARLAGDLDWSYIKDRTRNVKGSFVGWDTTGQYIEGVLQGDNYYEAIWEGQDYRPEVWVEKDALVDVIARGCRRDRVPYFSCRGYVSQSEMYDAAKRMERRVEEGLIPVVIHLGDHDPSGIDMTRDIRERLTLMAGYDIAVNRVALNRDQVDRYQPPPNPTKITDSRAEGYLIEHGQQSWELDALEPSVLVDLIHDTIDPLINREVMDERRAEEQEGKDVVQAVADRWEEIERFLRDTPADE